MFKYGQYCPVARAAEIFADRWTPLIVRELLAGSRHFNEIQRGLPGISRSLLVSRLQHLEDSGVVERHAGASLTTDVQSVKEGTVARDTVTSRTCRPRANAFDCWAAGVAPRVHFSARWRTP